MWHEYIAYIIIAGAFLYMAFRIGLALRNRRSGRTCATCTENCQLKGLTRVHRKEKQKICTNKKENRTK